MPNQRVACEKYRDHRVRQPTGRQGEALHGLDRGDEEACIDNNH